jgi:hypothetical protein
MDKRSNKPTGRKALTRTGSADPNLCLHHRRFI